MAESTLTQAFADLQATIGRYLGMGRTTTNWSTEELAVVEEIINAGARQFMFPEPLDGVTHIWSFLSQTTKIVTVADDFDYDLGDSFGGIEGTLLTYDSDESFYPIELTNEYRILRLRQNDFTSGDSGRPRFAAVRPKTWDPTTGQRWEMIFWPTPDAVYNISFQFKVLVDKLDATNLHHLGGMAHTETVKSSCLAVAERQENDDEYIHQRNYLRRLAASISYDRQAFRVDKFGYNGDGSDGDDNLFRYRTSLITYQGGN